MPKIRVRCNIYFHRYTDFVFYFLRCVIDIHTITSFKSYDRNMSRERERNTHTHTHAPFLFVECINLVNVDGLWLNANKKSDVSLSNLNYVTFVNVIVCTDCFHHHLWKKKREHTPAQKKGALTNHKHSENTYMYTTLPIISFIVASFLVLLVLLFLLPPHLPPPHLGATRFLPYFHSSATYKPTFFKQIDTYRSERAHEWDNQLHVL